MTIRKILKLISIPIVIIFIGIIGWRFGLFERYNYFTAHWDILNKNVRIISMGKIHNFDKISMKYGFYNCSPNCSYESKIEENAIKQYNDVVNSYLNSRNGNNWELKYRKECDSLLEELNKEDILKDSLYQDPIDNILTSNP